MATPKKPTKKTTVFEPITPANTDNSMSKLLTMPKSALDKRVKEIIDANNKIFNESELKNVRKANKERLDAAETLKATEMESLGKGGVLSKLSSAVGGTKNQDMFKSLSTQGKAASTVLKTVMDNSSTFSNALEMMTGGISVSTAAFSVLAWATQQAIDAFVEGFNTMREIQKDAVYRTNFTAMETAKLSRTYMDAADRINAGITDLSSASEVMLADFSIQRITTSEALKTFQGVIKEFKDQNLINDMKFAELVVGLEEMGYSISGPLGQFMKTQYYRDTNQVTQLAKMDRTNEILNKLVGLSKSSTMSLDELVAIMGETNQQNLNAWTLIRSGMSEEQATRLSTSYSTSKAAVSAAADTLGLSSSGVDAIFSMFNEIIASATDPTRLGDLTKKYQVGGMTGGKSISEMYKQLAAGNFIEVFRDVVMSSASTAKNKSGLGFEYLQSQFGSNITTVLGAFTPTVITKLLDTVDKMAFEVSDVGESNELLGEIKTSILSAPITVEDILNSIFDVLIEIGADFANFVTGVGKFFGISKDNGNATGATGATSGTGYTIGGGTVTIGGGGTAGTAPGWGDHYQLNTEVPGSVGNGLSISDYYANDTSGWFTNNDIKGASPYRLTAGYRAPAYAAKFGSQHNGVDYGAKEGTPVKSPVDGEVIDSGYNSTAGNYLEVKDAAGRIHKFAHLSKQLARRGDIIKAGQVIGLVGATGKATGSHIHYAVKQDGKYVNPNKWAGSSFGGLPFNYGEAMGGQNLPDNGYSATASTTSSATYYNTTEVVSSINDLNQMLSDKLDLIIMKMSTPNNLANQFNYGKR